MDNLALVTPLLAILWMALISLVNNQKLDLTSAHFRLFGMWDFIAMASAAWLVGLLGRILEKNVGEPSIQKRVLLGAACIAIALVAYASVFKVSQMVVLSGFALCAGVMFFLGLKILERKIFGIQAVTIMLSTFFAAAAWMGLRYDGQSISGILCRGWLALAFFASAWLAMRNPHSQKSLLGLPISILSGYVFAAGVSLAPLTWSGEPQMLFGSDGTLMLALVFGTNMWLARNLTQEKDAETELLGKFLPITFLIGLVAAGLLWVSGGENDKVFAATVGLSLLIMAVVHFGGKGGLRGLGGPLCFLSLLSPLVTLSLRHWVPGLFL